MDSYVTILGAIFEFANLNCQISNAIREIVS